MTVFHSLSRSALPGLAMVALVSLAACHKQDNPPTPAASAAATGPSVTGGRLVLSAIPGHPAAAYFDLVNGSAPATVNGVKVEGADQAAVHETVGNAMKPLTSLALAAGETVRFSAGGKHVMVFGPKPSLHPGETTNITFTFSGGSKLSAPLRIEAAGGTDAMAGMKM